MRRRIGESDDRSPPSFSPGKFWLLGAVGFEFLFLFLNFSVAISLTGIFLAAAHIALAGAAALFFVSSAILRLRTNYPVGIAFTAILIAGALFGGSVVHAAIASV